MVRNDREMNFAPVLSTALGMIHQPTLGSTIGCIDTLSRRFRSEIASTIVEYSALVGFIALAAVLAITAFGLDLAGLFSIIQDGFGDRTHEWGGVIN